MPKRKRTRNTNDNDENRQNVLEPNETKANDIMKPI